MKRLGIGLVVVGGVVGLLDAYYSGNLPFSPSADEQTPPQQRQALLGVDSPLGKAIQKVNNVLPVPLSALAFFGGIAVLIYARVKGRK